MHKVAAKWRSTDQGRSREKIRMGMPKETRPTEAGKHNISYDWSAVDTGSIVLFSVG